MGLFTRKWYFNCERLVNTAIDSKTFLRTDAKFVSLYKQCIALIESEKLELPSLPRRARIVSSYKDRYLDRVNLVSVEENYKSLY